MSLENIKDIIDESIYDEMDNMCAELLEGDDLVRYVIAKEEAFEDLEAASKKYFGENMGDDNEETKISTFGDFFYEYLAKYGDGYNYVFNTKGYTKKMRELVAQSGINPEELNINWGYFEKNEDKYQELLVDILYAQINYELSPYGYAIFGLNFGHESTIYFVTTEDKYRRLKENEDIIKIFDIYLIETIYGEIYEVTGDLGVEALEKGDFLEKRDGKFYTLFNENYENKVIENIDENNDSEVKIIL